MNLTLIIILSVVPIVVVLFILQNHVRNKEKKVKSIYKKGNIINTKHKNPPRKPKVARIVGIGVLIPFIIAGSIIFITFGGCSNTIERPIFLVELEGKKYMYHSVPFFLENAVENNETVDSFYSKVEVYPIKDELYISPDQLKEIALMLTGEFELINYEQFGISGFITKNDSKILSIETKTLPTDKIGQTIKSKSIQFNFKDKEISIEWTEGKKIEPIKNCEIKSVWEVINPYPGKTLGNFNDKLLVNLTEMINYLHHNATLELVDDNQMLVLSGLKLE